MERVDYGATITIAAGSTYQAALLIIAFERIGAHAEHVNLAHGAGVRVTRAPIRATHRQPFANRICYCNVTALFDK